ncbi:hypothetical protein GUITHDRAFT_112475 [Guillardia theta CCMP2712]|uniref:CHAT domain-containing protein n=2 Tax=Guillardia theta TaxID=55529 RepID=L1IZI8_GUITC|nr:hypothetical protein GUITHDRAFT_112475 [Guillardia theta CCMP2712]EKX41502.1 hypothetical protein GUITHDRAFT_112475 [Guillardia theta CCMP2712]|eukprot:XP_005828482.1 hypothetical protein GUITHDRAFT_112475 [Guillardia theta CCMP2712]
MSLDRFQDEISLLFVDGGVDSEDEDDANHLHRRGSTHIDKKEIDARWEEICDLIDSDQHKTNISATVVVDFPFRDMSGKNGLRLDDGLLERAWFFKINGDLDKRFVLHGHTFMRWSQRLPIPAKERAAELTSVNMRLALFEKSTGGWRQMKSGETLVPYNEQLKQSWKSYYFNEGLRVQDDIKWKWSNPSQIPRADAYKPKSKLIYERIRKLLALAQDNIFRNVPILEAQSMSQTNKRIRGSRETIQELELYFPPECKIETNAAISEVPKGKDGGGRDDEVHWPDYPKPDTPPYPHRLLFVPVDVHAGPNDPGLNLKDEYNSIHDILSATDANNLSRTYSSTWGDVMKEIKRQPLILHFSCHSDPEAIKLFRQNIVPETIMNALQAHNEEARRSGAAEVQLVVLNACYSDEHARKLAKVVDFAIGHKGDLIDQFAISFAQTLYGKLFQGQSLLNSWKQAEGCSSGYRLYGRRDASAFCLRREKAEDTEMVRFFKEQGFTKIARRLCEELYIEDWKLEDLQDLTEESLHVLTETRLLPHQQKKFWRVVREKVRELSDRTAQLCSPSDLSEADTISESDVSDRSDSEDEACQSELVIARNEGNKEDFEIHMTCFLQGFGRFSGSPQITINDSRQVMETEGGSGGGGGQWTMCMLLWLKVMKDARMGEEWREKWDSCIAQSASQDKLLQTLGTILEHGDVEYRYWNRERLADLGCKKRFASVVFLTDELVSACLPDKESCRRAWHRRVMKDWDVNKEDVGKILARMNKFLWSQAEAIEIITNVIETGSYVCYMRMEKIASLILFEYLETYKREKTAEMTREGKPVSSLPSLFQGFSLLASSSSEPFALQKISSQRLREIRSNLRVLSRLPGRLLLFMGPARRAGGLLEEDGRSMLTAHQKEKAKLCEEAIERRRGVHLRGPAGTGKTFMALHMMLRELEKDRGCSVLFLLRSEAFVFFIAHWAGLMARWKLVDEGVFGRIFFSFRREGGWDGPFWMTEEGGELRRQEKQVEILNEYESKYKFVVIDQAHHVYCDREARDYIELKRYDKARMMLMSDSSQAVVTNISYPQGLDDVYLTEVVRNSNRTMTASLLFQKGISADEVSCHHKAAGRPVKPYIFSLGSSDNQAREYAPRIVDAMREVMVEYPENLDRKIAILVHERLVQLNLKQLLQDYLDKDSALASSFKLIAAVDAWKTTRGREDESDDQCIIFDTVENFDGMESKVVIAVGLDEEERDADLNLHRSLLYRAITRALKEGMVMIVNHRVEQGLLSFLDVLSFANQFESVDEKKKISKTPWEHLEEAEGETSLQTEGESGAGVKGERQTEEKCEHDDDNAGIETDQQVQAEKMSKLTSPSSPIVQSVWDTRRHEGGGGGGGSFQPYIRTPDLLQEQHDVFSILRMFILDEKKLDKAQQEKCVMIKSNSSGRPRVATRGMRSVQTASSSSDKDWAKLTLEELHDFCGKSPYVLQVIVEESDEDEVENRRLRAVEVGEAFRRYKVTEDFVVTVSLVNFGSSEIVMQTLYKSDDAEPQDEGSAVLPPWSRQSLDHVQTRLEEGQRCDTIILQDKRQGTTLQLLFEGLAPDE